jgi:hypothetical protein
MMLRHLTIEIVRGPLAIRVIDGVGPREDPRSHSNCNSYGGDLGKPSIERSALLVLAAVTAVNRNGFEGRAVLAQVSGASSADRDRGGLAVPVANAERARSDAIAHV